MASHIISAAEPALSVREAAAHLGISQDTIRRRIADGTLPSFRVGHLIRIHARDLDRLAAPEAPRTAEARIRAIVDEAPPLSPEQVDRLTELLRGVGA